MVLQSACRRFTRVRPTTRAIADLTLSAQSRLDRLAHLSAGVVAPVAPSDRRLVSYVTIEAASLWAEYSRCLYLSCAFGGRDAHGNTAVVTRAGTVDDAVTQAVHAIHPKLAGQQRTWQRNELPDFKNAGHLRLSLQHIGATVYPDVDRALSVQTRVLADLPTMRNYFAHKAERAAGAVRSLAPRYGLSRSVAPEELLVSVPGGRGDILLREWLADMTAIFGLMP